ncbi:hypothetical protein B0T26DRAFT_476699 [Lasiosphaeria miniovina]|uniref:Uncharacterized protein n=1 Tax=Lasiosphaeria miniovina TaxID=1954250 RepID=A0AA40DN13_9PEZI|nr:uncharacterized protein B0T26DRAFT_476699 [Lasiosphaeria miniovina]KAK0706852.1 hypothetical protein B0T26DRAFT_476699 [Lasiosphaeria miniovina]
MLRLRPLSNSRQRTSRFSKIKFLLFRRHFRTRSWLLDGLELSTYGSIACAFFRMTSRIRRGSRAPWQRCTGTASAISRPLRPRVPNKACSAIEVTLSGIPVKSSNGHPLLLIKSDDVTEHEGDEAPPQKRGWALQERLLSRRILHFSSRQLVWECNALVASESFSLGVPQTWKSQRTARRLDISRGNHRWRRGKDEIFLEIWGDIVERYTAMYLTYRSDLLPALSGVAKYLEGLYGAKYLAKIWKKPGADAEFSVHLGWKCTAFRPNCTRSHSAEYRTPTWSWASTEHHVNLRPSENPFEGRDYGE